MDRLITTALALAVAWVGLHPYVEGAQADLDVISQQIDCAPDCPASGVGHYPPQ